MMDKEGHMQNDLRRFGTRFPEVHEWLDSKKSTADFWLMARHTLDACLAMYQGGDWNMLQYRAALFHLIDDFGSDMLCYDDLRNPHHWISHYLSKKNLGVAPRSTCVEVYWHGD